MRGTRFADQTDIAARPVAPRQPRADRADPQMIEQQPAELLPHRIRQRRGVELAANAASAWWIDARLPRRSLHRLEQVGELAVLGVVALHHLAEFLGLARHDLRAAADQIIVAPPCPASTRAPRPRACPSPAPEACRRDHADPRDRLVAGHARLRDGRHVRQRLRALRAANGERARAAAADMRIGPP